MALLCGVLYCLRPESWAEMQKLDDWLDIEEEKETMIPAAARRKSSHGASLGLQACRVPPKNPNQDATLISFTERRAAASVAETLAKPSGSIRLARRAVRPGWQAF